MAGPPDTSLCCSSLVTSALTEQDATELAGILKALADPVRLRIVSLIASTDNGELCACDMPAMVDRSQPTTSHHLTLLVKAGLLKREQRGKLAWFALCGDRLAELGTLLVDADSG
ncbi:MAG: helix-turn-helix transcriptional regulator [Actinomycetia bacterium]|nr:helix-turn-helix transcriptional regulator [Actinomycetes bacterium]MCP4959719.1 helix-turn-helix transcriptional regulator [Actinomycetes bacterium]